MINYQYLAHALWTTTEAVERMVLDRECRKQTPDRHEFDARTKEQQREDTDGVDLA
jgi:hypothetical protein